MKQKNDQLIVRLLEKESKRLKECLNDVQKLLDTNHVELWSKKINNVIELNRQIKEAYAKGDMKLSLKIIKTRNREKLRAEKSKIELDEWNNSLHEKTIESKFEIKQQIENLKFMIIDFGIKIEMQNKQQ